MTSSDSSFESYRSRMQSLLFEGMPEHVRRLSWDRERIAAHQRDRLRSLVADCLASSPFHARRLRGIDPARLELADLARIPVMTKAEMMDDLDDVFTDRRLSRALVEDTLARTGQEPLPILGEYVAQASGGSSGRRGVFVIDREGMVSFASSLLRPMFARLGGAPPSGFTIAMVGAGSAVHATGIPPAMLRGSAIRFVGAPAALPIEEIVERLNAIRPHALFGYPSVLSRLAPAKRDGRLAISPLVIRSTSETLLPEHRAAITEAFGVPVADTFGSSEGLVGTSEPGDSVLTFASDTCIVELVDEDDRPVPPGQPSAKILVTNLDNRIQPLVRYAIDDRFVRQPDAPSHGHLRALVRGRSDEVLRYETAEIHPIVVRSVLVKTPEIADYQVRQTATGIDVAVVADGCVDRERLGERLRSALREAGLADPTVTTRTVAALERNPATGKVRRFVPV